MRFLGLSPLAAILLAVFTTVALVAMYFLKLRHRRVLIASSMLWSRVLDRREERSLWEKLRWLLSVILVASIGLLMVFAVARPEITSLTGTAGRTTIVMDTSPSMLARMADGRSRWQHAVETASGLVASSSSGTEFRVVDTSGQFDSPFTSNVAQVKQAIESIRPMPASPRFPESDDSSVQTYFISDGVAMPAIPQAAKKLLVYETARNTGITAFEVRAISSTPVAYEAFLEVTNFGNEAVKTTINVTEAGPGHLTREAKIEPGHSYSEILDLAKFEGGGIRATIQSEGDALAADDIAYTYLPLKKKTRVLLVTKGNAYLQTALKLDSFVDLTVVDPGNYREDPAVDAYIFDGFAPPAQPSRPALVIGAQNVPWLRSPSGTVEKPVFTTWAEDHPVMQYLSLHDVSIGRASTIDASNLLVLAASGQTALVVASPPGAPGARWVMLTFELQSSDFPVHESFPVFMDNTLAWFGRERLALRRTTGTVEVPIANALVTGPDGKAVDSRTFVDRTVFAAPVPGLYVTAKDGVRQYVAVNFMNRQYSNINHTALERGTDIKPTPGFLRHEPWFYLLLLAVLLLVLEWFTYHRRITL